tara:strand:- start:190 stop:546 length:357 start_codon:yes stop_codon:yes gene_type:complete
MIRDALEYCCDLLDVNMEWRGVKARVTYLADNLEGWQLSDEQVKQLCRRMVNSWTGRGFPKPGLWFAILEDQMGLRDPNKAAWEYADPHCPHCRGSGTEYRYDPEHHESRQMECDCTK